ncbi:MAG: O-antigen ligase family protein [Anaerolineae bacterium]
MWFNFRLTISLVVQSVLLLCLVVGLSTSSGPQWWIWLLLPLQLLLLVVLIGWRKAPLYALVISYPLVTLELLPHQYATWVLWPSAVLLFFLAKAFDPPGPNVHPGNRAVSLSLRAFWLLAAWVVVSAAHAYARGWWSEYVPKYTFLALQVLFAGAALRTASSTQGAVERLAFAAGLSAAAASLVLLLMPVNGSPVGIVGGGKIIRTPFGESNMNAFGVLAATHCAMFIGFLAEKRVAHKLLLSLCVAVMLVALVRTQSRGAWLGFGASVLFIALRNRSLRTSIGLLSLLVPLVLADTSAGVFQARIAQTGLQDASLMERLLLWQYALRVISSSWLFGVGMENFRYVKHLMGFPLPMSAAVRYNAHSLPLELAADVGVVGVVCVLVLLSVILRRLVVQAVSGRGDANGGALGLSAAIVAYLVHSLVDALTWQPGTFMAFGCLLGLGAALALSGGTPSVVHVPPLPAVSHPRSRPHLREKPSPPPGDA